MKHILELTEHEMDFVWDGLNLYVATEYANDDGHEDDFISNTMRSIYNQVNKQEQENKV